MVEFRHKEIIGIFISLSIITTIIFGIGVFLGKTSVKLEQKDPPVISLTSKAEGDLDVVLRKNDIAEMAQVSEPLPETPQEKIPEKEPSVSLEGFTVQIQIFENEQEALKEKDRWIAQGFPSVFVRSIAIESEKGFSIDLGYFKEKETAVQFATKLHMQGKIGSYWIRKSAPPTESAS